MYKFIQLLIALVVLQTAAPEITYAVGLELNTSNVRIPNTLSALIEKTGIGKKCNIVFSNKFGSTKKNLEYLLLILARNHVIKNDIDCNTDIRIDVLTYVKYLAIIKQQREAASFMLFKFTEFNLDGELAEFYAQDYLVPVLSGYKDLDELLSNKKANWDLLTKELCISSESPHTSFSLSKLVDLLKKKKSFDLVRAIKKNCDVATTKGN